MLPAVVPPSSRSSGKLQLLSMAFSFTREQISHSFKVSQRGETAFIKNKISDLFIYGNLVELNQ